MSAALPVLAFERMPPDDVVVSLRGVVEVVDSAPSALARAHGTIVGAGRWDAARFDLAPQLRVLSRTGIGVDSVDLDRATALGVMVTNTPDGPTVSTAEHAVTLMLAVAKQLPVAQQQLRVGTGDYVARSTAIELDGLTLGLVGYGRIGRRVATVARALGMHVVVHDPFATVDDADEAGSLAELLGAAHVVSLHLPLTTETARVVDRGALGAMRPGALLVNTARGGLVDHQALLDALDSGHLAGAGLDVTDPEPLPPGHPLLARDDVIVTPHIASSTVVGKHRMFVMAVEQALMALRGERPTHLVNPDVVPREV